MIHDSALMALMALTHIFCLVGCVLQKAFFVYQLFQSVLYFLLLCRHHQRRPILLPNGRGGAICKEYHQDLPLYSRCAGVLEVFSPLYPHGPGKKEADMVFHFSGFYAASGDFCILRCAHPAPCHIYGAIHPFVYYPCADLLFGTLDHIWHNPTYELRGENGTYR